MNLAETSLSMSTLVTHLQHLPVVCWLMVPMFSIVLKTLNTHDAWGCNSRFVIDPVVAWTAVFVLTCKGMTQGDLRTSQEGGSDLVPKDMLFPLSYPHPSCRISPKSCLPQEAFPECQKQLVSFSPQLVVPRTHLISLPVLSWVL